MMETTTKLPMTTPEAMMETTTMLLPMSTGEMMVDTTTMMMPVTTAEVMTTTMSPVTSPKVMMDSTTFMPMTTSMMVDTTTVMMTTVLPIVQAPPMPDKKFLMPEMAGGIIPQYWGLDVAIYDKYVNYCATIGECQLPIAKCGVACLMLPDGQTCVGCMGAVYADCNTCVYYSNAYQPWAFRK